MSSGLRERKKADTRRRLADAALDLATARGVHGFTVAEVAAAAGVSPRTFFNYYRTKEEAVFRWDADELDEMAVALVARPAEEHPVAALAAAVTPTPERVDAAVARWTARSRLVERDPGLLPHHLAGIAEVEARLATAMRERLGSPVDDPFPVAVVGATLGALRATLEWRDRVEPPPRVMSLLATMIGHLSNGFQR